MRLIFTFFLTIVTTNLLAQACPPPGMSEKALSGVNLVKGLTGKVDCLNDTGAVKILLRCHSTASNNKPTIMVDRKVVALENLNSINPNDIESVTIVKEKGIMGCRGGYIARNTILITLKRQEGSGFAIVDAKNNQPVAGATITLRLPENMETVKVAAAADEQGEISFDLDEPSYEVEISSIGYETKKFTWWADSSKGKTIDVQMQRKVTTGQEVFIVSKQHHRGGCGGYGYIVREKAPLQVKDSITTVQVFPNPLPRNATSSVQIVSPIDDAMQVKVVNLSGQLLVSFPAQVKQGINRFTIPANGQLSAGMHFVQVIDGKGKLIQTDKLIIQ